ncbi:DUF3775 domain-containing protein [Coralloluteibacterium thermophilus]|uniref:DUF3775 domain-containing protein n=1 Tax=Coralloluteibacterium thermophilum TaxID=2707049 RepID=A0ABV9NPK0_9GAMM
MLLKELTANDIKEIAGIASVRAQIDRPEEYQLGETPSPAWDAWRAASANLAARIDSLSSLAKAELTALAWLGRGDSGDDFAALVAHAIRSSDAGDCRYLAAKTPLHTYLSDGARKLGVAI